MLSAMVGMVGLVPLVFSSVLMLTFSVVVSVRRPLSLGRVALPLYPFSVRWSMLTPLVSVLRSSFRISCVPRTPRFSATCLFLPSPPSIRPHYRMRQNISKPSR